MQADHDMGFHCGSAAGRTGESNYYWRLEPVRGLLNFEVYSLYSTFDNLQELQNRVCGFIFDLCLRDIQSTAGGAGEVIGVGLKATLKISGLGR